MVEQKSHLKIEKSKFVANKTTLITDEYVFGTNLGTGSFGTVRRAIHKKTNQARAVKIIKKEDQDPEELALEVDILSKLSHPNIMQIYEFFQDSKNFYIVSELCSGGELFDMISERGSLNEADTATIIRQVLSALSYSHQNNIVHRDLKPENILMDNKSDDLIIKLIDWGGAKFFSKSVKLSKVTGTPYYIAPEVIHEKYDEKCDIWSAGVMLYILLCGYPPFNGDTDQEIMESVKKGVFEYPEEEWSQVSDTAKDLINNMLEMDTKKRFSAQDCLNHKFIKNIHELSNDVLGNIVTNMKKFKAENKLEQATVSFIVNQLISKEERNELLSQFQAMDENGDGVLTKEEVYDGFKKLYGEVKAMEEAEKIFESCDLDGNGTIDYNEFLAATINRNKILSKNNLENAFAAFDKDGSGAISAEEIMEIFQQSGTEEDLEKIKEIMRDADENNDGEISLEEFKVMMAKFFS